ncbi:MAG: Rieske 2Fe-2S domain-containing protein [Burkholderiales bacterium]|nr:Rieske 2Fe-2S domain-containing protein [Burkholderiales bacterium]
MLSAEDNVLLTRTGPNTPMGEYFRRFWQPVALSSELLPDGAPLRVRILGQDWVAFRSADGRVGLVDPRCAHRGADLFFGRNEEGGLRCIYHGWKYDHAGRAAELPNVPSGSAYHDKIAIAACPTREAGDMVWAWLGPPEAADTPLPALEFMLVPPGRRYVTKRLQQCNWAHSIEGALDTAHFSFLHMPAPARSSNDAMTAAADEARIRWLRNDPLPRFSLAEHECGFVVGGARDADPGGLYWRITQFMLPSHSITPSAMPGETLYGYSWVPIDDVSCWIYVYAWHPEQDLPLEERARYERGGFGQFAALGPGFVPLRHRGNDYLIDRDAQKTVSFTGVAGIAEQDAMAQDSQGLIADRTREHLSPTDMAVVRFRRMLLGGARELAAGTPPAAARASGAYRVRGGGALAPSDMSFEAVMVERFGSVTGRIEA